MLAVRLGCLIVTLEHLAESPLDLISLDPPIHTTAMPKKDDGEVQPSAWTLRFKHGKHTILLYAEPLTLFTTLKTELLQALQERYPSGLPSSTSDEPIPVPDSIEQVLLGVPVDTYEPSKGWVEITTDGGLRESPKSLGLKSGCMIAFTFVDGEQGDEPVEFHVEFSSYEEQYPEDIVPDDE